MGSRSNKRIFAAGTRSRIEANGTSVSVNSPLEDTAVIHVTIPIESIVEATGLARDHVRDHILWGWDQGGFRPRGFMERLRASLNWIDFLVLDVEAQVSRISGAKYSYRFHVDAVKVDAAKSALAEENYLKVMGRRATSVEE